MNTIKRLVVLSRIEELRDMVLEGLLYDGLHEMDAGFGILGRGDSYSQALLVLGTEPKLLLLDGYPSP